MSRPYRNRRRRRGPGPRQPKGRPLTGERLELAIEDVAHGGHCIARHEGRVVFVRHTLPGEQVVAVVTSGTDSSAFLRADAVEVLEPSPRRRTAPCPVSGPGGCGGCDWQHADPGYGRELKARVVTEQLRRLAGIDRDIDVEPVPGDRDGLRWRTRLEVAVDRGGRAGLRRHRSHEVEVVQDCLIATEEVLATGVFEQRHNPRAGTLDVVAPSVGEALVVAPEVPQVVQERVRLADHALTFDVDAAGFWQVHPGAARALVETVLDGLRPATGERVVDLYSGVGLFAAELARHVGPTGSVTAVEGDSSAASHARDNLAETPWAESVHGDVKPWSVTNPLLAQADLVVLDPPRTGAGREITEAMLAGRPRAVAYVACDPAALARDLATAREAGYGLSTLRAFDLFPMTHHVECVAILTPEPRDTDSSEHA